jgi:hypothetical protein
MRFETLLTERLLCALRRSAQPSPEWAGRPSAAEQTKGVLLRVTYRVLKVKIVRVVRSLVVPGGEGS